jgi:hypothetical protein
VKSPMMRVEVSCSGCKKDTFLIDEIGEVQFVACFSCMRSYTYERGQKREIK